MKVTNFCSSIGFVLSFSSMLHELIAVRLDTPSRVQTFFYSLRIQQPVPYEARSIPGYTTNGDIRSLLSFQETTAQR